MDTKARIEAARERLDTGYAVLLLAKQAGPPCTKCVHYIPPVWRGAVPAHQRKEGPYCGHLAYTEQHFDTVSGGLTQTVQVPALQARGDDGLCGYEAILFEPGGGGPVVRAIREIRRLAIWVFDYLWSSFMIWFAIISGIRYLAS